MGGAVAAERAVVDGGGRDAGVAGGRRGPARRVVGEHESDCRRIGWIGGGAQERGHVGPAAGDEDADTALHAGQSARTAECRCGCRARRPAAAASMRPRGNDGLARGLQDGAGGGGIGGDDGHADAAIEHAQHLLGGDVAGAGEPGEHGRQRSRRWRRARRGCPSGRTRGRLPGRPPPVMWAAAFSRPARCSASSGRT